MKNSVANVIRWSARVISIMIILFFLVFLVGEFDIEEVRRITLGEIVMLMFVPFGLIVGLLYAWKHEIVGGIVVVGNILAFNLTSMIVDSQFTFEMDFGMFMIVGLIFIICGMSNKNVKN